MRPSRNQTYMEVARALAKRSTCQRGQVGAVLVLDRRIVATGYNGSPPGAPHCTDVGCEVPVAKAGCQRTLHAEANVIAFAARHGQATDGAVLYSTHGPCLKCAQLIASAGISEVHFEQPYRLDDGLRLLDQLNIPATQFTWNPEPDGVGCSCGWPLDPCSTKFLRPGTKCDREQQERSH